MADSHKLGFGPVRRRGSPASQDLVADSHKVRGGWIEFSADDPLPAEPLMPGAHNRENAAAATAAAHVNTGVIIIRGNRGFMTKVAFLGTGLLGSGMIEAMLGRGDRVTVWNRTASKARALERFGATVAAAPEDAVAAADHVHMALPDDAVVDEIMARCAPHLRKGPVVLDHSTTSPAGTKARLPRMQAQGYAPTEVREEADVILFNTCSVREHAEERALSNAGMVRKLKKKIQFFLSLRTENW